MASDKNILESNLPKISKPANRALANAGFIKLDQFTNVTESEHLALDGVGPKAIRILNEAMKEKGLSFAAGGSLIGEKFRSKFI